MRVGGRARSLRIAGTLLVVLVAPTGCGFANALAHPEAAAVDAPTLPPVPAVSTPDPDAPRVIADGVLLGTGGATVGRLVVSVLPMRTGLVPPVPHVSDCHFDVPSLQYVPIEFSFVATDAGPDAPGNLAAQVDVGTGPATPADIGDVGIFVESGNGAEEYCTDFPPLPTTDRFWNQMGARSITAWVVLDGAVGPATPQGRPEVFPTLQLRISHLRRVADAAAQHRLVPGPFTTGGACADDPNAICVPLG